MFKKIFHYTLKNFRRLENRPKKVSERSETQIGFRVGLGNPLEGFRIEKRVSEGSETLKEFPIVTNSETEKGFRILKTNSFVSETEKVSEFVTIGNSLRVSEPSETL
jgi:DNA helicase HerA-like ATPase